MSIVPIAPSARMGRLEARRSAQVVIERPIVARSGASVE
jgi:hypothetical protein